MAGEENPIPADHSSEGRATLALSDPPERHPELELAWIGFSVFMEVQCSGLSDAR